MTPLPDSRALTTHARIIRDLGFPIVVAIVLLYVILADVPANVAETRSDVAVVRAELAKHVETSEVYVTRLSSDMQRTQAMLARIMQQICVNTATTTQDREGCFP